MDLISTRTMDITKLALDGLMMRQKAITANTANVMTPDYQRKEVNFESQLKEIVEKEDLKTMIKEKNSIQYNMTAEDVLMDRSYSTLTPQESRFLKTNSYAAYSPQITDDTFSGSDSTGNNVNLEKEVMDMTGVGLKYSALAQLESKQFHNIAGAIKGEL